MPLTFTPALFFQYSTCPHWIWYDYYGDLSKKGDVPELAQNLLEQGVLDAENFLQNLQVISLKDTYGEAAYHKTLELMKEGAPYIYQGAISYKNDTITYQGRPDLLEKREGKSQFGNYYYAPIDIKNSKDIKRDHWFQLTLYALILEKIQNMFPTEVAIINTEQIRLPLTIEPIHRQKTLQRIKEIHTVMLGSKPPLKLVSKCKNSPWFSECIREAEAAEDIALLYKLNTRIMEALRNNNIHTLSDMAQVDITTLPLLPYLSIAELQRAQLQAKALLTDSIFWLNTPNIPTASLKIYFDIEGDPLLKAEYLFGFWIVGDTEKKLAKFGEIRDYPKDNKYYLYFLAINPEEESLMWNKFIQWVDLLNKQDYLIYHFADYERVRTHGLAHKYNSQAAVSNFLEKLVDLSKIVQQCVIFPLYFYSIKDIAQSRFVDYIWRHPKAGGAQSIFWYEKWLETNNKAILTDIINYNEDDVIATEHLHQWLSTSYKV